MERGPDRLEARATTPTGSVTEVGETVDLSAENNGIPSVEIKNDGAVDKVLINPEGLTRSVSEENFIRRERISFALKIVSIATFAYLGVLARVLLSELNRFMPFFQTLGSGFLLPNIVGSFVMGVLTKSQNLFYHKAALYAGITTGFCGCCTTFATWQAKVAKTFLDGHWDTALAHIFLTFCTSFCAFELGTHVVSMCNLSRKTVESWRHADAEPVDANAIANFLSRKKSAFGELASRRGSGKKMSYFYFDDAGESFWITPKGFATSIIGFLVATATVWILLALDPNFQRRKWWAAASFAPIGAGLRFFLALYNQKTPDFPVFTFIANVVASVCNIILYTCEERYFNPKSYYYSLWAMSGVSTGLMGSLSTVSTWVNEVNKLTEMDMRPKWVLAYRYAIISVVTAQVLCVTVGGVWRAVVPLPADPVSGD